MDFKFTSSEDRLLWRRKMKEKTNHYKTRIIERWKISTKKEKGLVLTSILIMLIVVIGGSMLASHTSMVPLYNNLTLQEAGQIKVELDGRGIPNEVGNSGTSIHVPDELANQLLVELAAQGIPQSGGIDYSFFSQNSSWGVTDKEFDIMKLDAMQTELANLITSITGIEKANVMISMTEPQIFVSDEEHQKSASIVLHVAPGHRFDSDQISALYHLVSKSVPNLPVDNIGILDQNFNYYDLENNNNFSNSNIYLEQQEIKQDIERDIQRRVQQMLTTMIGPSKVVSSVTADIDFTQEKRVEQLIDPITNEIDSLPVSVERIHETYSGEGASQLDADESDIPGYEGADSNQGDYELIQESINYEFNRIQREVSESPYKIRDLGIQVAVDRRKDSVDENGNYTLLSAQEQTAVELAIASILESITKTTIDASYQTADDTLNTSIVFQEFSVPSVPEEMPTTQMPFPIMIAGGVILLLFLLIVLLVSRRRQPKEEAYTFTESQVKTVEGVFDGIDQSDEPIGITKKKKLEEMALKSPGKFAELLRTWIAED